LEFCIYLIQFRSGGKAGFYCNTKCFCNMACY